jgi:hypothetical protein
MMIRGLIFFEECHLTHTIVRLIAKADLIISKSQQTPLDLSLPHFQPTLEWEEKRDEPLQGALKT